MKLAVSSYSFSQYTKKGLLTLQQLPAKAAEMGFEGIEYIDLPKDVTGEARLALAAELGALTKAAGIEMVAYTIGANLWQTDADALRAEIDRLKSEVDVTVALGASVMRHDLVWGLEKTGSGRGFLSMMPQLAEAVREVADYAAARGVKTCSENHGRIAQDSYRMEAFVATVNHDNYGLLVDMGNFLCADEDPATAVSRVANYAVHAHAKDMLLLPHDTADTKGLIWTRGGQWLRATAIGEGSVPVERCIRILKRAGYDGWLSVEYEGAEDCIEGIAKGLKNLQTYLARI